MISSECQILSNPSSLFYEPCPEERALTEVLLSGILMHLRYRFVGTIGFQRLAKGKNEKPAPHRRISHEEKPSIPFFFSATPRR